MSFVPDRLASILGRDPHGVTEEHLAGLLGLPESDVLDFKRERVENGESKRRDLAADIAAFANHRGGLIVLGVREARDGDPASLAALDPGVLDAEELRIQQIVATYCAPAPEFQVLPIRADDRGYLIVLVAPSAWSPHAVIKDNDLRYPIRSGSSKRYMSESEVADRYRSRFAAAESQRQTLEERVESRIQDRQDAVLTVGLQPNRVGTALHSRSGLDDVRDLVISSGQAFPTWHGRAQVMTVRPGFRRYVFSDSEDGWYTRTGLLFLDGGGTFSHAFNDRGDRRGGIVGDADDGAETRPVRVADEDIVGAIINSLTLLTHWARRFAGTGGEAAVIAQVVAPDSGVTLWQYRSAFRDKLGGTTTRSGQGPAVDMTVSLDELASDPVGLLLTARALAEQVMADFGFVEPFQITESGQLRLRYFHTGRQADIQRWAEQQGVTATLDVEG